MLAHELGHCFVWREGFTFLSKQEEEGLCELFAYLWLTKLHHMMANKSEIDNNEILYLVTSFTDEDVEFHRRRMENNKNEMYGDGFKEALKLVVNGWPFQESNDYRKHNRRYPNFAFGEDYQLEKSQRKQRVEQQSALVTRMSNTLAIPVRYMQMGWDHWQQFYSSCKEGKSTCLFLHCSR